VSLKSADPSLGTFVTVPAKVPASVTVTISADGSNITFSGPNATEVAIAVRDGYVFSVSPQAAARNLADDRYVQIVAKDQGSQFGETAIIMNKIVINQGPIPLFPVNQNINVSRGKRFSLELPVFKHNQGLPMVFGAQTTDFYPIPQSVRIACNIFGDCTARGTIADEESLSIYVQGSDQFIIRTSYFTLVPVVIPIRPSDAPLLPFQLRPGQQFQVNLPDNLFVSSSDISYTSVRLATGFPLPFGMVFDPPNILRGLYSQQGLLQVQLRAQDLFFDSVRNFTLNFTNVAPFCRNDFVFETTPSSNDTSAANYVQPVSALKEFERSVDFSRVCFDVDNDPMELSVDSFSLPSWLKFDIRPPGLNTLPKTLRLSGTPPKSSADSLLIVNVTASDTFAAFRLSIPLRVLANKPPRFVRFLENYTIAPGDVETFRVDLSQYVEDPNNDDLTVTTEILTEYAKSWLANRARWIAGCRK